MRYVNKSAYVLVFLEEKDQITVDQLPREAFMTKEQTLWVVTRALKNEYPSRKFEVYFGESNLERNLMNLPKREQEVMGIQYHWVVIVKVKTRRNRAG